MPDKSDLDRRGFIKLCASAAALASCPAAALAQSGPIQSYRRAKLVDEGNRLILPRDLAAGENYVFHYPYICTPCFLLNLGAPAQAHQLKDASGRAYPWTGGVGPERSIVAFSAICSHKMSHPARAVSFINYRNKPVSFYTKGQGMVRRAGVIYCCSENSVYDPARGAEVLSGPAPQPLATIVLEYDAQEKALYAVGTRGAEMFQRFFQEFGERLGLEFGTSNIKQEVGPTITVTPLARYSRQQVMC